MYTTTPLCRVALATAGGKAKSALDLRRIPDLQEDYKGVPIKHPFGSAESLIRGSTSLDRSGMLLEDACVVYDLGLGLGFKASGLGECGIIGYGF